MTSATLAETLKQLRLSGNNHSVVTAYDHREGTTSTSLVFFLFAGFLPVSEISEQSTSPFPSFLSSSPNVEVHFV